MDRHAFFFKEFFLQQFMDKDILPIILKIRKGLIKLKSKFQDGSTSFVTVSVVCELW